MKFFQMKLFGWNLGFFIGSLIILFSPISILATTSKPIQIAAGGEHTCALYENGKVACWGNGREGQLGNGSMLNHPFPTKVYNLSNVVQITAGSSHNCALLQNGRVKCWGQNKNGELGNGTTTKSLFPLQVKELENVTQISAGNEHTCAVLKDGSAKCWGDSFSLNLDRPRDDYLIPVNVLELADVTQITAGSLHTCALLQSGQVKCWGNNGHGQLGTGNTKSPSTPALVENLDNVIQIVAGGQHTCVLLNNGTAKCWGINSSGELGNSSVSSNSLTPQEVESLSNAVQITSQEYHTCALLSNGRAKCWGSNGFGQLGNDSTNSSNIPVEVKELSNAIQITASFRHTCALLRDGLAKCWGYVRHGRLGNGSIADILVPTEVENLSNVVQITSSTLWHTCALLENGKVQCWGYNWGYVSNQQLGNNAIYRSPIPMEVENLNNVIQISAGWVHTCALLSNEKVKCWGSNFNGELGFDTETSSPFPSTEVENLSDVVQISAGGEFTCALLKDETVKCWGDGSYGQLGNSGVSDTAYQSTTPVIVENLNDVSQIASGILHTCALLNSGNAKCWGNNFDGQLGNSTTTNSSIPVDVINLNNATEITTGDYYTCAVINNDNVKCWGFNGSGDLGNGSTTSSSTPVDVKNLNNVTNISAHCAVLKDSSAKCWGFNLSGELGNGTTKDSLIPVRVKNLTNVDQIAARSSHSCALLNNGRVKCWGFNSEGQAGQEFRQLTPDFVIGIFLELDDNTNGQLGQAIIVAGGPAGKINPLWKATDNMAKKAYRMFQQRGFEDESIYLFHPQPFVDLNGTGDFSLQTDIERTKAKLEQQIATFSESSEAGPLFLYLIDHGFQESFQLTETDSFTASDLEGWLDHFQNKTGRQVVVIIDTCYSGSFIEPLKHEKRMIFTSSPSDEVAYFSDLGTLSYSSYFIESVQRGHPLIESHKLATKALKEIGRPYNRMQPQYYAGFPDFRVGFDTAIADFSPIFFTHTQSGTHNGKQPFHLEASMTFDANQAVWAIFTPPDFEPIASSELGAFETPNTVLPRIDLQKLDAYNSDGVVSYKGSFNGFEWSGTYSLQFFSSTPGGSIQTSDIIPITVTDLPSPTKTQNYEAELPYGWNLVALKKVPNAFTIEAQLALLLNPYGEHSIDSAISAVWGWQKGINKWGIWMPGKTIDQINQMYGGTQFVALSWLTSNQGYWFDMNLNYHFKIDGAATVPAQIPPLHSGWNLVNFGGETRPLESVLSQLSTKFPIHSIWGWDQNQWQVHIPGKTLEGYEPLTQIEAGKGYG